MRKHLVSVLLSSSLLVNGIMATPISAQSIQTGKIVKSVNFRNAPSVSSDEIRLLKSGEVVTLIDKVNAYWFKVKDSSGKTGYVTTSTEHVKASWEEPADPSANATALSPASFRSSPEQGNNLLRYLKTGERLTVLEKTNAYWYKIRDRDGRVGYVSTSSKYIRTTYQEPERPQLPKDEAVERVIAAGMEYLGIPYEFGSSRSNTDTFDCSDFVRQAFLDGIGLRLPADSRSQGEYVKKKGSVKTNWRQLKPGDVMFFMEYKGNKASDYDGVNKFSEKITHNGIYIGNGKILQTYSKQSGGVRIDTIEGSQWEKRFLFGGSAL